jgi:hypothetical protein
MSSNGQLDNVDPSTSPQIDIGSETLVSVTIWGQTVAAGTSATLSDPLGGNMRCNVGPPQIITIIDCSPI